MLQKLSILFFVIGSTVAAGDKWDYLSAQYGVTAWATNFPDCKGRSQSPIDLTNPTYRNLGDIQFENYANVLPQNVIATATNNNHTYSVTFSGFTGNPIPTISGGGLPGKFQLAGFHFHWGNDNSLGSEHHVDNKAYPAELHLVHLNEKYASVSVGLQNADGLAVLGVLIQRGQFNENYGFLNHTKYNVTYPGMTSNLMLPPLMNLLPSNKSFYRYNGSLTTPRCEEVVTWTVFSHPVEVSDEEFFTLRDMMFIDFNGTYQPLVNNHRPLQPLNGRMLLSNFGLSSTTPTGAPNITTGMPTTTDMPTKSTTSGATIISESYFMFVGILFVLLSSVPLLGNVK